MKIVTVEKPGKPNPYMDNVAELKRICDETPDAGGQFETTVKDLGKTRTAIAAAARELDRTASFVKIDGADGAPDDTVTLTVRLKAKHRRFTPEERAERAAQAEAARAAREAEIAKTGKRGPGRPPKK